MYFLFLLTLFLMGVNGMSLNQKTSPCPDGWTYFNATKSCYIYKESFEGGWDNGEFTVCHGGSGSNTHLVSIHSAFENNFIASLLPNPAIAIWIGYHSDSGSFGWTDNSLIDYTNFNNDPYPDNLEQCTAYFAIGGNEWMIQPCNVNDINGVVCKQPANV